MTDQKIHVGANVCGQIIIETPKDAVELKAAEAVEFAESIITALVGAMDWRELRPLSHEVFAWGNWVYDCARAMYHCPNCGVGPYGQEDEPFERFDGHPERRE